MGDREKTQLLLFITHDAELNCSFDLARCVCVAVGCFAICRRVVSHHVRTLGIGATFIALPRDGESEEKKRAP